jgi:hypothetical protein
VILESHIIYIWPKLLCPLVRSFSSLLPVHQNPRRRCIRQVRTTRGPGSSTCSGASVDLSYGDSVRASMAFGVPPVPPALSPPRVRRGPRAGHGNQAWLYVSCRVVSAGSPVLAAQREPPTRRFGTTSSEPTQLHYTPSQGQFRPRVLRTTVRHPFCSVTCSSSATALLLLYLFF